MSTDDDDPLDRALAVGFRRRSVSQPPPSTPASASSLAPGGAGADELRFGEFRIIREVGRGGMGIVYEAEQVSLGRRVALKVLPFHGLGSPARLERFRREAQAVARLHHTNIVTVYGVGEHDGTPYLALRFIEGQSLDRVIAWLLEHRGGGAPPPNPDPVEAIATSLGSGVDLHRSAVRLGVQVAEGLEYAHQRGVLHRDIKPSNLLLDAQGTVWIADFGLAKAEGADEGLTRPGDVLGTIGYMAPERFQGDSLPEGDIYSLGLTLYEILTLRPAFEPKSRERLVKEILESTPPTPRRIDPSIPRDLETIVLKAIARAPVERYRSAGEMAADLRAFLEDRPISARRASAAEQAWRWCRRNPVVAALGSTVAILLLVLAVGSLISASRFRVERDAAEDARGKTAASLLRAEKAERERSEELYRSSLARVRMGRLSRRAGQRFDGLSAIRRATALLGPGGLSEQRLHELRDEAIACLATPDVRVLEESRLPAEPSLGGWSFDGALEHFSLLDPDGLCIVRRLSDGAIENRLESPKDLDFWWAQACQDSAGRYLLIQYLASGSSPSRVVVWDRRASRKLFERPARGTPDLDKAGQAAAFASPDGGAVVVRLPEGEEMSRVGKGLGLDRVRLSPSLRHLAAFDDDGRRLRIFDLGSRGEITGFDHDFALMTLSWSPDERWIATAGYRGAIHVYDVERRELRSLLRGHAGGVINLDFDPLGEVLASSSWDNTGRIWDPFLGRELLRYEGSLGCFSIDGKKLAYINRDRVASLEVALRGALRVLVARAASPPTPWAPQVGPYGVAFSPDGRLLAGAYEDGVRLWDAASGREAAHLAIGYTESVRFHPGMEAIVTFGEYGLHRWPIAIAAGAAAEIAVGPPQVIDSTGRRTVQRLSFDRAGKHFAYTDRARERCVVLAGSGAGRAVALATGEAVMGIDLSPDGRWAVTTGWKEEEAVVWDTATGEPMAHLSARMAHERTVTSSAAFSPDGRWLVTGTRWQVIGWRTDGWTRAYEIPRDPLEVGLCPLAFSPRGDILAVARKAQSVDLVDAETGRELAVLAAPDPQVISQICFSPDGGWIAASVADRSIQLWDLRALRAELAALGLERDFPDIPPAAGAAGEPSPLRIRADRPELPRRQFIDLEARLSRGKLLSWEQRLIGNPAPGIRGLEREVWQWLHQSEWTALCEPASLASIPEAERTPFERIVADLERFLKEMDTGFVPPNRPANVSPREGEVAAVAPVVLSSSPFGCTGGESRHGWSRWQVRREEGDYDLDPIYDVLRHTDLTRITLPEGLLLPGARCSWRVAHIGADGQVSPWSEESSFAAGDLRVEPVPFDLSKLFNRDVVADPGDLENDDFDPGEEDHPFLIVDGYDGERTDNPRARGLPAERRVGVHVLSPYDRPNAVQIGPADREPVRLEGPRRRCRAVRFLLSAGWGNALLPVKLEYASGRSEETSVVANDWYNRLPPTEQAPIEGDAVAVRSGMDHMRNGALVDNDSGSLFETILDADPIEELVAVTLEPALGVFVRPVTRVNLFAVTGIAVKDGR